MKWRASDKKWTGWQFAKLIYEINLQILQVWMIHFWNFIIKYVTTKHKNVGKNNFKQK